MKPSTFLILYACGMTILTATLIILFSIPPEANGAVPPQPIPTPKWSCGVTHP